MQIAESVNRSDQLHDMEQQFTGLHLTSSFTEGNFISGEMLLSARNMEAILSERKETLQTQRSFVAASLFSKYYCRLLSGVCYGMTKYRLRLPVTLSSLQIGVNPFLTIHISEQEIQPMGSLMINQEKTALIQSMIDQNLVPLFNHLITLTDLPIKVLWENAYLYIRAVYRKLLEQAEDPAQQEYIYRDYDEVCRLLAPYHQHITSLKEPTHIRKTCCFKYLLPAGKRCKTCCNQNSPRQ